MEQFSTDELVKLRELLDKQAIYENVVKYCRGADRLDIDLLKDAYWEDGTDDHGVFSGNAHEFCDFAMQSKELLKSVSHHVSNVQIELSGNQAKVETYFLSAQLVADTELESDAFWLLGGRYKDLYEKREGLWKILHRVCLWDWSQYQPSLPNWDTFGLGDNPNRGGFAPDDPIYKIWKPN